jgi:2-polyprenyl-3-methyl-5-hydroxy-6-metoxy-1,4-benzoquinol methylase
VSKKVVGVDIQKEDVERLRKLGYEVVWGDVTTINLGKKFDVIVAGELIEHLPDRVCFWKT